MTTESVAKLTAEVIYQPQTVNNVLAGMKVEVLYLPIPSQQLAGMKVEVMFSNILNPPITSERRPLVLMT